MAPVKKQQRKPATPDATTATPERSPAKKTIAITQRQKQVLIDNLQLEITERARRLRAQYAMQAQSLRGKLERRVTRVPQALRSKTMGELLLKYTVAQEAEARPPQVEVAKKTIARKDVIVADRPVNRATPPKARGTKRKSEEMLGYNKENTPDPSAMPVPKRQARDAAGTRTNPSMVLSPKSNNSRTLPQSPLKKPFGSPAKSTARPQSPLKTSTSPIKSAAALATHGLTNIVAGKSSKAAPSLSRTNSKTTKAPTRLTKQASTTQTRTVSAASNVSGASGTSTGTIVRRVGAAIKGSVAQKKGATAATKTTTTKRTATAKAKPEPATTKRTLRTRA